MFKPVIGHLIYLDKKIDKKHTKIIDVQDAFTVHKGHIKCTVAQKRSALTPIFSIDF